MTELLAVPVRVCWRCALGAPTGDKFGSWPTGRLQHRSLIRLLFFETHEIIDCNSCKMWPHLAASTDLSTRQSRVHRNFVEGFGLPSLSPTVSAVNFHDARFFLKALPPCPAAILGAGTQVA